MTSTKDKKEAPDGLWNKCKKCKQASTMKELKENFKLTDKELFDLNYKVKEME